MLLFCFFFKIMVITNLKPQFKLRMVSLYWTILVHRLFYQYLRHNIFCYIDLFILLYTIHNDLRNIILLCLEFSMILCGQNIIQLMSILYWLLIINNYFILINNNLKLSLFIFYLHINQRYFWHISHYHSFTYQLQCAVKCDASL